jgi:preprotein translocase subunit SecG
MNTLFNLIIVAQVLSALAIIGLVLLQHGKGADMGAAFGSGASGSLFGATGSSNFLSKSTAVAAAIFFMCTIALAHYGNSRAATTDSGVMGRVTVPSTQAPATTAPANSAGNAVPATAPAPAPAPAQGAPAAAAPAPANQIPK